MDSVQVETKQTLFEKLAVTLSMSVRRFKYFIERILENQGSLFGWMFAILVMQIAFFGAVLALLSGSFGYDSFCWGIWDSWTFMADPGTHAGTVEASGVGVK